MTFQGFGFPDQNNSCLAYGIFPASGMIPLAGVYPFPGHGKCQSAQSDHTPTLPVAHLGFTPDASLFLSEIPLF